MNRRPFRPGRFFFARRGALVWILTRALAIHCCRRSEFAGSLHPLYLYLSPRSPQRKPRNAQQIPRPADQAPPARPLRTVHDRATRRRPRHRPRGTRGVHRGRAHARGQRRTGVRGTRERGHTPAGGIGDRRLVPFAPQGLRVHPSRRCIARGRSVRATGADDGGAQRRPGAGRGVQERSPARTGQVGVRRAGHRDSGAQAVELYRQRLQGQGPVVGQHRRQGPARAGRAA